MKWSTEDYDQMSVFTLKGEFTAEHTDEFRKVAADKMQQRHTRDFVLELKEMEFIDSKGLEALLWLQEQAAENLGQVRLAALTDNVAKIMEITRLAARFDTHRDVDAAIKSLR
jgi:anti-anti-sigma factor